jgi:hypothetical protein
VLDMGNLWVFLTLSLPISVCTDTHGFHLGYGYELQISPIFLSLTQTIFAIFDLWSDNFHTLSVILTDTILVITLIYTAI